MRRSRVSYGGGCGYQNPCHGGQPGSSHDEISYPEPVEEVWRFSLDFTFSAEGTEACQYFQWDLQPFSFGELSFHKANPRPGRAAQAVAEAAHVQLPGSAKGRGRGRGRGSS